MVQSKAGMKIKIFESDLFDWKHFVGVSGSCSCWYSALVYIFSWDLFCFQHPVLNFLSFGKRWSNSLTLIFLSSNFWSTIDETSDLCSVQLSYYLDSNEDAKLTSRIFRFISSSRTKAPTFKLIFFPPSLQFPNSFYCFSFPFENPLRLQDNGQAHHSHVSKGLAKLFFPFLPPIHIPTFHFRYFTQISFRMHPFVAEPRRNPCMSWLVLTGSRI